MIELFAMLWQIFKILLVLCGIFLAIFLIIMFIGLTVLVLKEFKEDK
ncbi:MAG: hypothetical protein LUD50_04550 [Clostridia bacterium]|nr:hypothetical protein [Clostridia bacterium]